MKGDANTKNALSPVSCHSNATRQEPKVTTRFDKIRIITPTEVIERGTIIVSDDGVIRYAGAMEQAPQVAATRRELPGYTAVPGFIDIHVHGGKGITFGSGDVAEGLKAYSKWVTSTGVTGFLITLAAPDTPTLLRLLSAYADAIEAGGEGARPLGLHLEGPLLNPQKKGAFHPAWLHPLAPAQVEECLRAARGWLRQVTIAPELPGATEAARLFRQAGVTVALGHSATDYETASAALKGDYTHVTHTFNAQSGFDHRAPGVVGAILASQNVTAELIADAVHVHPAAMQILLRCLGSDRVVLVTDAMAAAGLSDGPYELVGSAVTVKAGQATLADGTLAGSVATLQQCVRNLTHLLDVPIQQAVQMATLNPARAIGLAHQVGQITVGRPADLVFIDDDVQVALTLVDGKIVYAPQTGGMRESLST